MSSLLEVPLPRRMHRLPVVRLVHGRAAQRAWSWDLRDQWTREWWPQGITWAGERLLVSWYSRRGAGSRVSVVDLVARRYAHVPLLTPDGEPLRVHAGGLAWDDGWLYVAATARGFWTLHVDDLAFTAGRAARSASDERRRDPATWPARRLHRPVLAGSDQPFRWSFLDLAPPGRSSSEERERRAGVETTPTTRTLLGGEYGRGAQSTRLAYLAIEDGQPVGNLEPLGRGPTGMQGATRDTTGLIVTTSRGPWHRGSVLPLPTLVGPAERLACAYPTDRQFMAQAPIGVEDVTRGDSGTLWTCAEHPGRRSLVILTVPLGHRRTAHQE